MPKHEKTVSLQGWSGINNVLRPERTDEKYLKEALNVDFDKSGGIQKRLGYSSLNSGDYHSLWSDGSDCFAVKDDDLIRINPDLTETTLKSGILSTLSFDKVDGRVYYTGLEDSGVILENLVSNWGIEEPNPKPTLAATSGGMSAGDYQVALTYLRSDGLESGSGLAQTVTVGEAGAITLTNIPTSTDASVVTVNVYVSPPDGEVLYLYRGIANGTSSTTITAVAQAILPLPSFNRKVAPKGQLVKVAHGRAFVAQDDILWFSDPYSYNWFALHQNYFQFPSRIVAIMPVEGGLWVAADKLYYLAGKDTDKMRIEMKEPIVIVEGTEVRIPGAYIFIENTPLGYKWLVTSDKGVYICFDDGVTLNVTETNYVFPVATSGTGVFVQRDGINRYLTVLEKKAGSDNTAVGDQVTAQIIRNGVTLED